jgi:hypothetical protein
VARVLSSILYFPRHLTVSKGGNWWLGRFAYSRVERKRISGRDWQLVVPELSFGGLGALAGGVLGALLAHTAEQSATKLYENREID